MRTTRWGLSALVFGLFLAAGLALGFHLPGVRTAGGTGTRTAALSPALPGTVPVTSFVATVRTAHVPVYAAPSASGSTGTLTSPGPHGQAVVLLVKSMKGSWLNVYLPQRPNGATGWIPAQDVSLGTDHYAVTVSESRHVLTAWKDGNVVLSTPVAVGTAANPTPQGWFYLTEVLRQPDPNGAYGPYAFGTSAFSPTLFSFGGGPGQIGLHGTDEPGSIGRSASHGCIRTSNPVITTLVGMLPLGTPVIIGA